MTARLRRLLLLLRFAALLSLFALCAAGVVVVCGLTPTPNIAQWILAVCFSSISAGEAVWLLWLLRRAIVEWRKRRRQAARLTRFQARLARLDEALPTLPTDIFIDDHAHIGTGWYAHSIDDIYWHSRDGLLWEVLPDYKASRPPEATPTVQLQPNGGVYRYDDATGAWVRLAACERAGEGEE